LATARYPASNLAVLISPNDTFLPFINRRLYILVRSAKEILEKKQRPKALLVLVIL